MRYVGFFVGFLALWLMWSGLYKPLLIGLGVASCLLCVVVAHRMQTMTGDRVEGIVGMAWRSLRYFPWLLREIVLSNLDVIRIVLSPRLPIDPAVLRLKASQQTDLGRVIYGNSITLTPGTLTMDIDGDEVTVHALTRRGAAALESGEMDRRVRRLEGGP